MFRSPFLININRDNLGVMVLNSNYIKVRVFAQGQRHFKLSLPLNDRQLYSQKRKEKKNNNNKNKKARTSPWALGVCKWKHPCH